MNQIAILGFLLLSTATHADVLIDQIGANDGGFVGALVTENQYFEPKFSKYDIAAIENFSVQDQTTLTSIDFVLSGWNGFVDPSSITGYQVNIYTSKDAAGNSLIGDYGSQEIDPADVTISAEWLGLGLLISAPTDLTIDAGDYWVSFIPRNPFATDGLTGVFSTTAGDGVMASQANPSGAYGFGPWQELTYELAIRLHVGEPNNPCDLSLSAKCPEDIDGNGIVDTSDLLEIISQWGVCGDGTYRPSADIAPLPNGDCCVDLTDILAVIATWDTDCNVYGACCLPDGTCTEQVDSVYCEEAVGYFGGSESVCADMACSFGACCIELQTCADLSSSECTAIGATYEGDGTICATYDCAAQAEGDECATSIVATLGMNMFDTTIMTPSNPEPTDINCESANLAWSNSKDVWFVYVPTQSHNHLITLCDSNSYDTSMAFYSGSCSNQIACNGDADDAEPLCQEYYSELELYLTQDETYYIRIGGWLADFGQGTLSIIEIPLPVPGACCFTGNSCLDNLIDDDCEAFGGKFFGEGTLCTDNPCVVAIGDECIDATQIYIGTNQFDTTNATPSSPVPDESMCPNTQLIWNDSPDIWVHWTPTSNGYVTFSTCDIDTYDTSMVLYESTCDNQVACNGDGTGGVNCQQYYSSIDYDVTEGTVYFIRMGGWQGSTGEGSIIVSFVGVNDTGACCTSTICNEILTTSECDSLGGDWYNGESCSNVVCRTSTCNDALVYQEPHDPKDSWFAGTSAYDPKNKIQFNRAEHVMLDTVSEITVWGFQLFNTAGKWSDCDATLSFHIRSYEDQSGLPGDITAESLYTTATNISSGDLYGGLYELIQWNINFTATNVEHLAVQSISKSDECWFLWMSSEIGDSISAVNAGSGWSYEPYDLSICVK